MTHIRAIMILALLVCLNWSPGSLAQQELTTLTTARGYRLHIFSELRPLEINRIHSWQLLLTDANGVAVNEPDIGISGGMPDPWHAHPAQNHPDSGQRTAAAAGREISYAGQLATPV